MLGHVDPYALHVTLYRSDASCATKCGPLDRLQKNLNYFFECDMRTHEAEPTPSLILLAPSGHVGSYGSNYIHVRIFPGSRPVEQMHICTWPVQFVASD